MSAGGVVNMFLHLSLSQAIGFMGLFSTLKGAKGAAHEVRERKSHVGSDEQAVHAILAQVGPGAALVLVCCDDQETWQAVVAAAADRAAKAGTARARSSSLTSIPAPSTTGCVTRSNRAAEGEPPANACSQEPFWKLGSFGQGLRFSRRERSLQR